LARATVPNDEVEHTADGFTEMSSTESVNGDEAVRAFYNSHPYPAPITHLERHRELYKNPERRRALFHLLWPARIQRANRDILVAGCGTSQAATYALSEPESRVTGIDISETSLRFTRRLQRKYGIGNLELHRLSVERVGELGRKFEQAVCTGVLHHLPDPDIGLRALRDVLLPEGAMHVMVYAAYGRAGIYMLQEYCRILGVRTSRDELRELDATIHLLSSDHPIAGVANRTKDFRDHDALADALLHPRDRAYTVPQLHAWLERAGLSFGRWFEQAPYSIRCGMVANMPHAERLGSLPFRLQHAAVELLRGTMATHNFTAYRNDYPAEAQPITFEGAAWRSYIPLRLPWTLCLRDRVPPGSVAVLINRAHTYADLALPIDAAEERFYAAIDGIRTTEEILRHVGVDGEEEQARRLFQRFWEYDQIAFDATRGIKYARSRPAAPALFTGS
jgi:SAM-dependent methyltransferase